MAHAVRSDIEMDKYNTIQYNTTTNNNNFYIEFLIQTTLSTGLRLLG